jgi:hypothetical protein
VSVSKRSGKVLDIKDQISDQISTIARPGVVHTEYSQAGEHGSFEDHLIKPFTPIDQDDHRNYYQEFCDYLTRTGHLDAIPSRAIAP